MANEKKGTEQKEIGILRFAGRLGDVDNDVAEIVVDMLDGRKEADGRSSMAELAYGLRDIKRVVAEHKKEIEALRRQNVELLTRLTNQNVVLKEKDEQIRKLRERISLLNHTGLKMLNQDISVGECQGHRIWLHSNHLGYGKWISNLRLITLIKSLSDRNKEEQEADNHDDQA
jgi:hypothetical protein